MKTVSKMDPSADDSCKETWQLWLTAEQARSGGGLCSLPEERGLLALCHHGHDVRPNVMRIRPSIFKSKAKRIQGVVA